MWKGLEFQHGHHRRRYNHFGNICRFRVFLTKKRFKSFNTKKSWKRIRKMLRNFFYESLGLQLGSGLGLVIFSVFSKCRKEETDASWLSITHWGEFHPTPHPLTSRYYFYCTLSPKSYCVITSFAKNESNKEKKLMRKRKCFFLHYIVFNTPSWYGRVKTLPRP